MQQAYTKTIQVQSTDVDFNGRLKPAALLRYVEQISTAHAYVLGCGEDFLRPQGMAFLLGKQALRFARVPANGETLVLATQAEQSRRGSAKRVTTVLDAAGQTVALVDARWILVDIRQGRILRRPTWDTSAWAENVEAELPQLSRRMEEQPLQSAGTRRADYSLCDQNGHINNSCYLDIACDALPPEVLRQAAVTYAALKYDREVPFGETMELFCSQQAQGWYVAGRREGKNAFECYMELEK